MNLLSAKESKKDMCLLIYKPPDAPLPEEHLKRGFEHNSDGAGFMYADKGILTIDKGFFIWEEFITAYNEALKEHPKAPFVVHFRLATSGLRDADNCHPHWVYDDPGVGLAHNGIFSDFNPPINSKYSDTVAFAKYIRSLKQPHFMDDEITLKTLEKDIGTYNKVAFLQEDGKITILNEKQGDWDKGVWYSNASYKSYRFHTTTAYPDFWGGMGCHLEQPEEENENDVEDYTLIEDVVPGSDSPRNDGLWAKFIHSQKYLYIIPENEAWETVKAVYNAKVTIQQNNPDFEPSEKLWICTDGKWLPFPLGSTLMGNEDDDDLSKEPEEEPELEDNPPPPLGHVIRVGNKYQKFTKHGWVEISEKAALSTEESKELWTLQEEDEEDWSEHDKHKLAVEDKARTRKRRRWMRKKGKAFIDTSSCIKCGARLPKTLWGIADECDTCASVATNLSEQ